MKFCQFKLWILYYTSDDSLGKLFRLGMCLSLTLTVVKLLYQSKSSQLVYFLQPLKVLPSSANTSGGRKRGEQCYEQCRISAGVMRCADKMQRWLKVCSAERTCVSHATFFLFWPNAPAACVLMWLSGLCLAECVSGNVFVEYASCLYAAEFVLLRAGEAYCVSCLLT